MKIAASTDARSTRAPALVPAVAPAIEQPYLPNRYFTNGAALYRVVDWLIRAGDAPLVELEDCHSLHLALLTREDLATMRLRPVRLAPASAA